MIADVVPVRAARFGREVWGRVYGTDAQLRQVRDDVTRSGQGKVLVELETVRAGRNVSWHPGAIASWQRPAKSRRQGARTESMRSRVSPAAGRG